MPPLWIIGSKHLAPMCECLSLLRLVLLIMTLLSASLTSLIVKNREHSSHDKVK